MATYSDFEQRKLDQESGLEYDEIRHRNTVHYAGLLVHVIQRLLNNVLQSDEVITDQHQQNGFYGAHQLRLKYQGRTYRLILAPDDAPISIGGTHADDHFLEPLTMRGDK